MQAAEIMAQVFGPFYLVVGIGMVFNGHAFVKLVDEFREKPAGCLLMGMVTLGLGLLILAFHSAWRADWTVIITLFGWAAAVKGGLLIVYPDVLFRLSRFFLASPERLRIWAAGPFALGLALTFFGYGG
jgi:hypothetical protein